MRPPNEHVQSGERLQLQFFHVLSPKRTLQVIRPFPWQAAMSRTALFLALIAAGILGCAQAYCDEAETEYYECVSSVIW